MRTKLHALVLVLALNASIDRSLAQVPVITSFSANGVLVCTNLLPGSVASVEWASSLSGPWTNNWAGLALVSVGSNGIISVSVPKFYRVRGMTNTSPLDGMVLVPAGAFTMGDTLDGESDAVPVTATLSAFYMDVTLVSYGQWQSVYAYATNLGYLFDNPGVGKAANHPVVSVNWYDCVKWCNARSQMAGLRPVYYTDAVWTQVYTGGDTDAVYPDWTASGYRLPTEAEWEKAARGGLSGQRFPWGLTISESRANYWGCTTCGNNDGFDLGPDGYNAACTGIIWWFFIGWDRGLIHPGGRRCRF